MVDPLVLFLASNKAIHLRLGAVLTAWHLGPTRCLILNFRGGAFLWGK